jgi:hypothetical protein
MASVMTVYNADRVPVGHIQDYGPGRVLAHVRKPDGKLVALGFFADRMAARQAVENGPPPEAA